MVLYLARNGTSFDPFLTYFNSASDKSGGRLEARKSCMYLEERKGKERKGKEVFAVASLLHRIEIRKRG